MVRSLGSSNEIGIYNDGNGEYWKKFKYLGNKDKVDVLAHLVSSKEKAPEELKLRDKRGGKYVSGVTKVIF